jgi:hypothetical protein
MRRGNILEMKGARLVCKTLRISEEGGIFREIDKLNGNS